MSDNYLIICPKRLLDNPTEDARKVIKWLHENEIVEKKLSRSVLGGSGVGFRPAENYLSLVKYEFEGQFTTCGLDIRIGNQVFDQVDIEAKITCPSCKENQFKDIEPIDFYGDTLSKELLDVYYLFSGVLYNYDEQKNNKLKCHYCEKESVITNYKLENICFSNLGLVFWNWPELKDTAIKEFETLLQTDLRIKVGNL